MLPRHMLLSSSHPVCMARMRALMSCVEVICVGCQRCQSIDVLVQYVTILLQKLPVAVSVLCTTKSFNTTICMCTPL
jgi:hypothetical protein